MSEYRVLGKEVTVRLTRNGALQSDITAVRSFTFEPRVRLLKENYLGEVATRQDEIFEEVGGTMTVHMEKNQVMQLQKLIVDRSTRRVYNDEKISITFRISFPDGTIARITIPDAKFESVPLNFSGRDAYIDVTLTYASDRYQMTLA